MTRRVVLVDDHRLLLGTLQVAIHSSDDLEVVATCQSLADFERSFPSLGPVDVVVVDMFLRDESGVDIVELLPDDGAPQLLLMTGWNRQPLQNLPALGFSGIINKSASVDELLSAVRTVADGGAVYSRDYLDSLRQRSATTEAAGLSPRESEVLELLANGLTVSEIAERMFISVSTTRSYVSRILERFGARSQLEAVVTAARSGLVDLGHPGDHAQHVEIKL